MQKYDYGKFAFIVFVKTDVFLKKICDKVECVLKVSFDLGILTTESSFLNWMIHIVLDVSKTNNNENKTGMDKFKYIQ